MNFDNTLDELADAIQQMRQAGTDGDREEAQLWHDKARTALAKASLALDGFDLNDLP